MAADSGRSRFGRPSAIVVVVLSGGALVVAGQGTSAGGPGTGAAPREPGTVAVPRESGTAAVPRGSGYLVAKVRAGRSVIVRAAPGGRAVGRLGDRTHFGSRTALPVLAERDGRRWLGVATEVRSHGRLGWIRADSRRLAYVRIPRALHVDLSQRRLELRADGRVLRRARVDIGRPGNPTPTGRFGVTDRMWGGDFGPWYGCCVIALSGRQHRLPRGWRGGNRLAIHGTASGSASGAAASSGCLRARDGTLRRLMWEVPLGTPVFIEP